MNSLKVLFVGNSFSVDTMEHAAGVALSMGIKSVKFGTLYVGGCSLDMHYQHATENLAAYTYYQNEGDGWSETPDQSIDEAVKSEDWDWIAIQHGTKGGSRNTSAEYYTKLEPLIDHIKALADKLMQSFEGLDVKVYRIKNEFFGENITVSGLLTGKDLCEQLSGKELGEELLFSSTALRADGDVFLDDITPEELSQKLGVPATPTESDGQSFICAVLGLSH